MDSPGLAVVSIPFRLLTKQTDVISNTQKLAHLLNLVLTNFSVRVMKFIQDVQIIASVNFGDWNLTFKTTSIILQQYNIF